MSITLPPIGARIRTTTKHDGGPVVVIEGIVTAHPKTSFGDERWVIVGNGAGVTAYVGDLPDAEVTVEVLEPPLPPEPEEGAVVQVGNVVLLRRTFATDGPERCWRATNDEDPWTWADVCQRDTPVRLVRDPAIAAPPLPWNANNHGDGGITVRRDPHDGGNLIIDADTVLSQNDQSQLLAILARQLKPGAERDALFAAAKAGAR